MAIYRRTAKGKFEQYEETSLASLGKIERELEDWLVENRELLFPNDDIFIFGRQERVGQAGTVDLLGSDEEGNLFVIELKRGTHGRNTIAQALDYVSELASWEYPDFAKLWQDYQKKCGQKPTELRKAHQRFHKLSEPLAESDFNRSQYIVIVSAGPDEKAERIAGWLKGADVPIYYGFFTVYQCAERSKELLIDVLPVELPKEPAGKNVGNDFWLNSCEKHQPGSWRKMIARGLACTYGPIRYGRKLEPVEKGSRVFLYVSRKGIVAEGIVTESWSGQENEKALTTRKRGVPEYSARVAWVRHTAKTEQAVAAGEIRTMGHKLFVPTFFRISTQLAQRLSDRLKEKCGK